MILKPFRSEKYLDWVRSLPCCYCTGPGGIAHHLIGYKDAGTGTKRGDHMAIPMCPTCHNQLHSEMKSQRFVQQWERFQTNRVDETQQRALRDGVLVIA